MEDSAFEAIYTGVYIFIFIAALTMTLYMFKNVNELAERSYEYGIIASGDRLIEAPEEPDKILNKSDIISYYCNYIKQDNYKEKEGNRVWYSNASGSGYYYQNSRFNFFFVFNVGNEGKRINSDQNTKYINLVKNIASEKYILQFNERDYRGLNCYTISKDNT